jgi:hypothetical protein
VTRPTRTGSKATARSPRTGAARLAITLFTLLAFTLQSYVAQIHIHGASWNTTQTVDAGTAPQPGKLPVTDDQNSCPICQVIAHAGQFVAPSAVAISRPALTAFHVTVDKDTAAVTTSASHSWKSRAPPRF